MDEVQVSVALNRIDLVWEQLFPLEQHRIVQLLVDRVIVAPNELQVKLHANGVRTNTIDFTGDPLLLRATEGGVTVSIPIRIRRYGGRKQVVVPQGVSADLNATAAPTAL